MPSIREASLATTIPSLLQGGPLPAGSAEFAADVVAQLALSASHEGRGPFPRWVPHGELPIAEPTAPIREAAETAVRRLIELTSRQQQTQRTLLDWLRVEYGIEKPSNKLLALTDLDSNTWVSEVKRIRGKKQPLSSAGLHALRDEYTRTIEPARALAAETLTLERTLSDLVNQAYALTPAEIALMWQTAPPRMPIPPPAP